MEVVATAEEEEVAAKEVIADSLLQISNQNRQRQKLNRNVTTETNEVQEAAKR